MVDIHIYLYLAGNLLAIMGTALCLRIWGTPPARRRIWLGLAAGALAAIALVACTTILSHEGHPWRVQILFWSQASVLLIGLPDARKAGVITATLFVFSLVLCFQFETLALSKRYTDAPSWRMRSIAIRNRIALREHRPIPYPGRVSIRSTPLTPLTGLYCVAPAAGGAP